MLGRRAEPILENLALAAGCPPEPLGRDPRGAVEGTNEVREIVEADIQSDAGDGARILGQYPGRMAQPGAQQILVGRHAEYAGEQAQKMKHAEPAFARNGVETDVFMRMCIDP